VSSQIFNHMMTKAAQQLDLSAVTFWGAFQVQWTLAD
jgi:hypothetical protein